MEFLFGTAVGCDPLAQAQKRAWFCIVTRMTKLRTKVLIVEDDSSVRKFLKTGLAGRGFEVIEAANARSALELRSAREPNVMVVDLGLPDADGKDFIQQVRERSSIPIVVLSGRLAVKEKVEALDLGANDYVTKPFNMDELAARIQLAVRHSFHRSGVDPVYRHGTLSVDLVKRTVSRERIRIKLTPTEFSLLQIMVVHAGKVITHAHMLRDIWNGEKTLDYLRIYIRTLRSKIELQPHEPNFILTVSGVGYQIPESDRSDDAM